MAAVACGSTVTPSATGPGQDDGSSPGVLAPGDPTTTCRSLPALGLSVGNAAAAGDDVLFPWDRQEPVVAAGYDLLEIIPGGPPPDGIRPIDEPCFDDVVTADRWLEGQSPVLFVEVDGDARAYPLAIMTRHEIVNDVVGGEPLVVTYCPLCNSGLAFERTVDGRVLDFGTSGRLFQSNLVMYDRQTRTLWSQFAGEAMVGADFVAPDGTPTELERIATSLIGWEEFREQRPDGLVLSPGSFPDRDYGDNPYPGYEGRGDEFLFRGPRDERIDPNARVVGLGADEDPVAIHLDRLRDQRVVDLDVDGQPVTVWWAPGQASALDRATIDAGEDVGSTAAFVSVADGQRLTFTATGQGFVDEETGSTWNLLGDAVDGPLAGARLEAVAHDDTFWFVWFAFQPGTEVSG